MAGCCSKAQETSSVFPEPPPRFGACAAVIGHRVWMYAGVTSGCDEQNRSVCLSEVEVFDSRFLQWNTLTTDGPNPIAYDAPACTLIGHCLYVFGGYAKVLFSNSIHELNTLTLVWKEVEPVNPYHAPMRKFGCGLVSYRSKMLCVFGGYGFPLGTLQKGSKFVASTRFPDGRGWTNELHVFSIETGKWNSPLPVGQSPPPCAGFSFVRVDASRIVLFGGFQAEIYERVQSIYILDVEKWQWSGANLPRTLTQPWPVARNTHTSFSLHDPDSNPRQPCLVVICGKDSQLSPLCDVWILDVNTFIWEEALLTDDFIPRMAHVSGLIHVSSTCKQLVLFGGVPDNASKCETGIPCIGQTALVTLEMDHSKRVLGVCTGWKVVRIENSAKLQQRSTPLQRKHSDETLAYASTLQHEESCLDTDCLVDVKRELLPVVSQWLDLGLVLGLRLTTLESIRMKCRDNPNDCMTYMLEAWLLRKDLVQNVGMPSWKALVMALRDPVVDHLDTAEKIVRKFDIK